MTSWSLGLIIWLYSTASYPIPRIIHLRPFIITQGLAEVDNVAIFHTFTDTIENYLPEDTLYIGRGPVRAEYNMMCSEGKLFSIVSKKVGIWPLSLVRVSPLSLL